MNSLYKITLLTVVLLAIVACNEVVYFPIDVQVPPKVNLAKNEFTSVLVVDNLPQTIRVKNVSHLQGESFHHNYDVDSLGILFKISLANKLRDENFSKNVIYTTFPVGNKTEANDDTSLLVDTIRKMARDAGADLIFSVDYLDITTDYWENRVNTFNYEDSLRTNLTAGIRVFSSNGESLTAFVRPFFSQLWTVRLKTVDRQTFLDESLLKTALKAAINQTADKASEPFLPQWNTTNRWYYTAWTGSMVLAESYVEQSDWVNAAKTWGESYDKEKKEPKLGKLAFNIALANEMTDDIENAITWINIAKKYESSFSKGDQERVDEYAKLLNQRSLDFKKMDQEKP